jgi:DNA invertase Pin-like site-specific DNA recombinase
MLVGYARVSTEEQELARSLKQLIETVEDLGAGNVICKRTLVGLQAARARCRLGDRSPALAPKDRAAARAMLKDPELTVAEVARRQSVAASTLYRHLPRAHTAALDA